MKTNTAVKTMIVAIVAMIGMTGFALANTTIANYVGDGSYGMTYGGSGAGSLFANTYTSDGFDKLAINFDAGVSGSQSMTTSSGWTEINRISTTSGGYGEISTLSGAGTVDGMVSTSITSPTVAKILDQDVDISSDGVGVETYHAASTDGDTNVGAIGGTTIEASYVSAIDLSASDHSTLYTYATADYGDSRIEFNTSKDGRGLPYGGTYGDGQLMLYTDTEYNFGQELNGTIDATTISVDVNDGFNGTFTTLMDFDSLCNISGYGATSYYGSVNN